MSLSFCGQKEQELYFLGGIQKKRDGNIEKSAMKGEQMKKGRTDSGENEKFF